MLETRELTKIYKPKKGVPVTALNKISLRFPEKGMVFLLGKSGSGKSTMLNLLGGLDKYDSGEIIIKGVSSKDFSQQHFDSYRNTYIGFIFQEYNILEEFTVGANIALALQLQGKKAEDEEINRILKEVDLDGYGNRKPNELSGGQKQRVAIARALVKNPEIIMADEPTGALDSNTGKQVFDTLKKLSKDKLIIIVSHDREFSELYADRIIELADGNIISDVEVDRDAEQNEQQENLNFSGDMVTLAPGYHLTEEDRAAINAYIDRMTDQNLHLKLAGSGQKVKNFIPTNEAAIPKQDGSGFQLIKSRLPFQSAFKIGASGLKHKKLRLVITIVLSVIAFGLFGLADTFGSYNHVNACTNSLIDSKISFVSLVKAVKKGSGINTYYASYGTDISKTETEEIAKDTGVELTGGFVPKNADLSFWRQYDSDVELSETDYEIYPSEFNGFAEITEERMEAFGYTLAAGRLPDGDKDEIAVSELVFDTFQLAKYTGDQDGTKFTAITTYDDLIGKTLYINHKNYTITGIIDTNLDLDRYLTLTETKDYLSSTEKIAQYALMEEYNCVSSFSLTTSAMVGEGALDEIIAEEPQISYLSDYYIYYSGNYGFVNPDYMTRLSEIDTSSIQWVDGEKKPLGEKEIIVSSDLIASDFDGAVVDEDGYVDSNTLQQLKNSSFTLNGYDPYSSSNDNWIEVENYKIVGILPVTNENSKFSCTVAASDKDYAKYIKTKHGEYSFVVGPMPETKEDIRELVKYCYREDSDIQYQLQNAVTYELDTINSVLKTMSKVFLYVGIGFAVFASLMLANFIATSISYKKQEIGILRAIGSRSNDVFRIFFSESFLIAMINFVLASIGVGVVTAVINAAIRKELGVLITILNFGVRQIALLFVVSIVVAALASFLPVKKIASKKPIDAIRNR